MSTILKAYRGLFGRPSALAALKNFSWLLSDKAVRFVLGTCVGFAVARHLGPEQFGLFGYVGAVVGLLTLLAEGGQDAIIRKEIVANPETAGVLLVSAFIWRLVVALVAYFFIGVVCVFGWVGGAERGLALILGLSVFQPLLLLPDAWYQARLESKRTVWVQWVSLFLAAVARLYLVSESAGVLAFAWVVIVEFSVAGALLFWTAGIRGFPLSWSFWGFTDLRKLWMNSWPLLISAVAVSLYMRIDAVMLRHLAGELSAGWYIAGVRLTEIWFFVPGALAASLMPALIKARASDPARYAYRVSQYCGLSAIIGYAIAVPTMLLAVWLIRFAYGPAYAESASVLVIHSWVILFAALGVMRGQICIIEGWTRFHLVATVGGALINVVLNWAFIPRWGPQGAAVATLVAQAFASWLSSFCYRPTRSLAWKQTSSLISPVRMLRTIPHA